MFQQIVVIGRLGKDPETRSLPNGKAVTNFSIATSEKWTSKSGEKQERTEWFNCSAFDRTAEIAAQYLKKGDVASVTGKMQTREWQDKEGNTRYSTDLRVDRLTLLPNGKREAQAPEDDDRQQAEPAGQADAFDDDIPF